MVSKLTLACHEWSPFARIIITKMQGSSQERPSRRGYEIALMKKEQRKNHHEEHREILDQDKNADLEGSDTHPDSLEDEDEEQENIHHLDVKIIVEKRRVFQCHIIMKFHVIISKPWPTHVSTMSYVSMCLATSFMEFNYCIF